jgi:DNA-directed RNA polymerase specialized sigma subunit
MVSESLDFILAKIAAARKAAPSSGLSDGKKPAAPKPVTAEQKSKEYQLWKTWKDSGQKPEHLDPLLKSFAPLIQKRVNTFRRVEVPLSAVEHEHKKWFVNALKSYDPARGTQLNTHITNRLMKAGRYIEQNKNFARIPENISSKIGIYNSVRNELHEKQGYVPTPQQVYEHMIATGHPKPISPREAKRLEKEQRKGLIQQGHENDLLMAHVDDPGVLEVVHLIPHQLTPQERAVHELSFGLNGKQKMSPGDIAKTLKMDNSKVSKLRTSIYNKMKPYLVD